MKKTLSAILVCLILLSLFSCDNEAPNTEIDVDRNVTLNDDPNGISTTENEQHSAVTSSEYTHTESHDDTTLPSDGSADAPDDDTTSFPEDSITLPADRTLSPSDEFETSSSEPTTPPSGEVESNPDNNDQPPSDDESESSSSQLPNTAPSGCEHDYTVASCTMPEICMKCQHIARNSLPHNYVNGTCTVCGNPEMLVTHKEGEWVTRVVKAGTPEQGEMLFVIVLNDSHKNYKNIVCYSNADYCVLNLGKVVYNGKIYYADYYPTCIVQISWEENGDTVTVTTQHMSLPVILVMTKTGEMQYTVSSSNDTATIPAGTVFTKQ